MCLPISRMGAAAIVAVLACITSRGTAGVVAPPVSDPLLTIEADAALAERSVAAPVATVQATTLLPLPAAGEPQPFWFPGADDRAGIADVRLSSVPVRGSDPEASGAILLGAQQHPLIPLPASAWTGMAGLLGLGAVKLLRNVRKLLA